MAIPCVPTAVVLATRPDVLSSATTATSGIVLEVTKLPDRGERFLRIRNIGQSDKPALAALVPASLLLPQTSAQGGQSRGATRIAMV